MAVQMGFIHIKELSAGLPEAIIEERQRQGDYLQLQDFIERLNPGIEQLNILIRIGAFRFTEKTKKELLWQANFLQKKNDKHSTVSSLFKEAPLDFKLPELQQYPLDDAMDEIELLGFPVCNVFALADTDLSQYMAAADIEKYLGKSVQVLGYLITSKPVRTVKQEVMYFHTFIDAQGEWLDTVFFPQTAIRYPVPGKGFYSMTGKVIVEFGVYTVDVDTCKRIGYKDRTQVTSVAMGKINELKYRTISKSNGN